MPKWIFYLWKAALRPSYYYKCHGELLPSSTSDSMDSFTRLILCKESVDCDRNFQVCNKLSSFPTLQKNRTQNIIYDIKNQPNLLSNTQKKCILNMNWKPKQASHSYVQKCIFINCFLTTHWGSTSCKIYSSEWQCFCYKESLLRFYGLDNSFSFYKNFPSLLSLLQAVQKCNTKGYLYH